MKAGSTQSQNVIPASWANVPSDTGQSFSPAGKAALDAAKAAAPPVPMQQRGVSAAMASMPQQQPVAAPAPQIAPAVPQWQQQYQDLLAAKGQGGPDLTQLLRMIQQPQQSRGVQAYMDMRGGGHYGGIIPQGSAGMPIFRQAEKPTVEQKNPTTFNQSPWPGVWGGV